MKNIIFSIFLQLYFGIFLVNMVLPANCLFFVCVDTTIHFSLVSISFEAVAKYKVLEFLILVVQQIPNAEFFITLKVYANFLIFAYFDWTLCFMHICIQNKVRIWRAVIYYNNKKHILINKHILAFQIIFEKNYSTKVIGKHFNSIFLITLKKLDTVFLKLRIVQVGQIFFCANITSFEYISQ